jgi:hypothetical protein
MREGGLRGAPDGAAAVAMEAHTGRANWELSPRTLKGEEDFFPVGNSRIVFHTTRETTPERLYPGPGSGRTAGFTRGQRVPMAKAWITYLSRSSTC